MKLTNNFYKILIIFLFFLGFQSRINAEDIREFEIEGMSIGDSLNNFFNDNEINRAIDESYTDMIYITKTFNKIQLENYEAIQVTFKSNDKKRKIVSIVGVISYANNMADCKKQMSIIDTELTDMFPTTIRKDWGIYYHNIKNTGHYFPITYDFEDGSSAMVSCHDWAEETGIKDNLKVSIFEGNYAKYIKRKN